LPAALVKAKEASEQVEAGTLFERLRALNQETQAILREARESGNNAIALQAIARAERQLELEARLLGELDQRVQVAVGIHLESRMKDNKSSPTRDSLQDATRCLLSGISRMSTKPEPPEPGHSSVRFGLQSWMA
jgi:hypothetical protein